MKNLFKIPLIVFAFLCLASCEDDTKNLEPSVPATLVPADEAIDVAKVVTLKWGASIDPEKSMVKYAVFVGTKADLTDEDIKIKDLEENKYDLSLNGHTTYYWKVVATDDEANQVETEVFSFTTQNTLPTQAVITEVVDVQVENKLNITFKWDASTDADGDVVKYDVYLSADDKFEKTDLVAVSTLATEFTKENVIGYTNYSIKVVSKDGIGNLESEIKTYKTKMIDGEIYLEEGTFTDTRDNHEYKTITINGTTWLAENFAYLPFFADENADEKKCSVYGAPIVGAFGQKDFVMPTIEEAKAHENFAKYGVMYSAYILDDIAPEGWHVATDEEWMKLERLSEIPEDELELTSYRGKSLHKFLSTDAGWTNDPAPSDEFKMNIKPGGYNKVLEEIGEGAYTYFWTNTYTEATYGNKYWNRAFSGTKTGVNRGNTKSALHRMYVRLVKDSE